MKSTGAWNETPNLCQMLTEEHFSIPGIPSGPWTSLLYHILCVPGAVLGSWGALRRKQEARIVLRTWAGEHFLRSDKTGLGSCHFSQGDLGSSPFLQTASCSVGKDEVVVTC